MAKYLDESGLRVLWSQASDKFVSKTDLDKVVVRAYYLNDKMWTDSTYLVEVEKNEHYFYLDKNNSNAVYTWSDGVYSPVMADATSTAKGVMKLYQTHGSETNGTMTQKAITDGVNAIKFELDSSDSECLVLDLPWD